MQEEIEGEGAIAMQEEPRVPKATDAVLGGGGVLEGGSAVLGGLEGLRQCLLRGSVEQRVTGMQRAMGYGKEGVEMVLSTLENAEMEMKVRWTAYQLLQDSPEIAVREVLQRTLPFLEFDVATVGADWTISRRQEYAQYFTEDLGNGVELEMVLIPGGTFVMGSPEDEPGRFYWQSPQQDPESPQHRVTVPTFFMGRYPITQAQWRVIASLPAVNRELKLDPSRFKGDRRPVERISWWDAVECCDRLSQATGREYRLPTEAEWEYACRAGTTTPFHFGETITADLANYDATGIYGKGVKGKYREETTPVDQFGVANAFGLSDMHGNVWEWCLDHWHSGYEGAPVDGSAWLTEDENAGRVIRGGSWFNVPLFCRSASRLNAVPGIASNAFGFRVVCVVPRILQ